jgi:hypothetical protein
MHRALAVLLIAACGSSPQNGSPDGSLAGDGTGSGSGFHDAPINAMARTVFVIPLENKSDAAIYGNTTNAPYINQLMTTSAYAMNMTDELPGLDSEPHYIWMEAGTNELPDHTFSNDNDTSMTNSSSSTDHLATQLTTAGRTWTAYQEGITTGACPIASTGFYATKHQPFTFFRDISGSPPSASNAGCGAHFKAIGDLAADLAAGTAPNYAFITPNLCNDMHGALTCPSGLGSAQNIAAGDAWLAANLPPLIAYTHTHDAVIFLAWDEGDTNNKIPFIAIGDHVVAGAVTDTYTHSAMVKTVEELLDVPVLATVSASPDLGAMFSPGYL